VATKFFWKRRELGFYWDFGQSFDFGTEYFTGWLSPRGINGLGDHFEFGLLPRISGLLRQDQLEKTGFPYCERRFPVSS